MTAFEPKGFMELSKGGCGKTAAQRLETVPMEHQVGLMLIPVIEQGDRNYEDNDDHVGDGDGHNRGLRLRRRTRRQRRRCAGYGSRRRWLCRGEFHLSG
jgi:hypothetical protein